MTHNSGYTINYFYLLPHTAGRVDKFRKRYGTKDNATPTSQA